MNASGWKQRGRGMLLAGWLTAALCVAGCQGWSGPPTGLDPLQFDDGLPRFIQDLRDERARGVDERLRGNSVPTL